MTTETFASQLQDMYQGEVIGEVLFDLLLTQCTTDEQRYKVATMLQLETETKARLRPALLELGESLEERSESREAGREFFEALAGKAWPEMMTLLRDALVPYLERYKRIAADAPEAWQAVAQSMVEHEAALYEFAEQELAGNTRASVAAMTAQLQFPLEPPG